MKTLKEFLTEYHKKEGWNLDSYDMHETLIECFDTVKNEFADEHRWYDVWDLVIKINIEGVDRFFQTFYYNTKGDGNADDYGLEKATVDSAFEVYPHTVSTTVYKSEPQEV